MFHGGMGEEKDLMLLKPMATQRQRIGPRVLRDSPEKQKKKKGKRDGLHH